MMPHYRSQLVRKRDADGQLAEAGFFWTEERSHAEAWFTAIFYAACAMVGLGLGGIESGDKEIAGAIVAGPALLAAGWCIMQYFGRRARGASFYRDGQIVRLEGIPGRGRRYYIAGHWDMIRSIECHKATERLWSVRLHFNIGTSVGIALTKEEDEARIAVVQLARALQEMRDAAREPAGPKALLIA
jgi:hypothetical protein